MCGCQLPTSRGNAFCTDTTLINYENMRAVQVKSICQRSHTHQKKGIGDCPPGNRLVTIPIGKSLAAGNPAGELSKKTDDPYHCLTAISDEMGSRTTTMTDGKGRHFREHSLHRAGCMTLPAKDHYHERT